MPRPKKHDFSDKKEICYRLYVEEKRPMRELLKYFKEQFSIPLEMLPKYVYARVVYRNTVHMTLAMSSVLSKTKKSY